MIKRVMFDLDNTIIEWKDNYRYLSLKESSIDTNLSSKLDKIIIDYENNYDKLVKEDLINRFMNLGISREKANKLIIADYNRYEIPKKELYELFDYLSSKYELVIVTNWFYDVQCNRLKNISLIKYFKEIYSADKYKMKPKKDIFIKACGKYKPNECLMIGDSIEKDIKGALNVGIDAIYVNHTNIKSSYKEIKDILELKEML